MVQQLALHTIGGVVTPAQQLMVVVPAESHREIEAMVQNKDIGFVCEGYAAEIKIDTFSFTKYSPLHGKVLSISADAIARDKPPTDSGDASSDKDARNDSTSSRPSELAAQEPLYSARTALDTTRMQVEGHLLDLAPGNGGDGRDQERAAADHRVSAVAAAATQAGEFAGEVSDGQLRWFQIAFSAGRAQRRRDRRGLFASAYISDLRHTRRRQLASGRGTCG